MTDPTGGRTTDGPGPGRWRRYGVPLLVMLPWFFGFLGLYGGVQALALAADASPVPALVWPAALLGAAAFAAVYVALTRWIEKRPATELALGPAPRELALGLVVGAAAFSLALGALVLGGLYTVRGGSGLGATGTAFAVGVVSGVGEEILFRGILFRRLSLVVGTYGALAGSAVLFGAAHLANPGATVWGALAIAVEAGLMLGLAYVVTGRLWLPIGLHAAWNYVQGGVFGVAVSGNDIGGSVWSSAPVAGRDALTGGGFGVEASPAAVVVCLAVSAVLWVTARRRGLVVPPAWRRGADGGGPAAGQTVSSTLPM
ncbi:MAG: CPBP family intramembrane metalloprotease [Actinobacteria bacterium]|nr:CPBP family intramembrane metalloprotease [Actinomycetota bacterium]